MLRSCCLALVLAIAPATLRADEAALADAVGLTGAAMWLDFKSPGLVLAVVSGPDAVVLGFGETAQGSKVEPNGRTALRIGSVSKAFAGQLLASLAPDGTVRPADPASKFLPGVALPEAGGRAMTLLDLATHSAGLPREVPGEPMPGANPFERFTWTNYKAYLAGAKLSYVPGRAAAYSNIGFGVLGEALAGAGGKPYADLLRERVTGPLEMSDTVLRIDEGQRTRLMVGHDFDGSPMRPYEVLDAMAASGGLYSTADDMVRFMRWHLDRGAPSGDDVRVVDHALYVQRDGLDIAVGFDEAGPMDVLGLAWVGLMPQGSRPFVLQKTGGLQGFMSYVALAPGRGAGAFVAANRFSFGGFVALTAANGLLAQIATR
jgi:D-alanyl-D-alanine-carboxypeptidase/D-alanyl-D-alanine-endopeptidase